MLKETRLDSAAVAEVDASQLERVLGPDWRTMGIERVHARAVTLETAAGFARTLVRYMDDACFDTAGEALKALAARNGDGSGPEVIRSELA
jgi:hypothetical protein